MTGPVLYVDIETTGLDPDRHEIWEVGLIDADGLEHSWFLPVDRLADADPVALEIGRYHQRHPKGLLYEPPVGTTVSLLVETRVHTRAEFAKEFARLTWGRQNHLCGASVSFDEERLRRLLHSEGQTHGWHYHLVDVEALAAGYLAGSWAACQSVGNSEADGPTETESRLAQPPWDSNQLSLAVGVDPDDYDRHTALGDCRWAKAIYQAVIGK